MANFNAANQGTAIQTYNYRPGLVYWPDHVWVTREPINAGVAIVQGAIYTKDADGMIIVPTVSSSNADFSRGIFQAQMTSPAVDGESDGDRILPFIGPTSFIVIAGAADITPGQLVDLNTASATSADNDKVKPRTTGTITAATMGRCLDILELSKKRSATVDYDDRARKPKTADDDMVLVRLWG